VEEEPSSYYLIAETDQISEMVCLKMPEAMDNEVMIMFL
jgi:hypothetical protein